VSVTVSPIRDSAGEVVGASSILRDITAHKHANERFRLAVESAPNAMLLTDQRGLIVLANVEAERLFGYTRAELEGNPIEMLVPRELSAAHEVHRQGFIRDPSKREMGVGRDLWALRKDGTQVAVEVGLNPIHGDGGSSVLASVVDISERRRVERERARLLRETQQAVEARDTFLSVASHELKTPLTALQLTVQGLLRAAARRRPQLAGDQLVKKLAATTRQVARLATLVDQLLDVSRLTAGRFRLERSRTDVSALVDVVVERFVQGAQDCEIRTDNAKAV
jgi:PAS domain S-box-containing protein